MVVTIYPAIDIRGGRCVRLSQGRADAQSVYAEDPVAVAQSFKAAGCRWVHVVDLDGAFSGEPRNGSAISGIVRVGLKVQLGGGLRTRASVERAIGIGVERVVIGTRAAESPDFVGQLVAEFGEKIAVGIDARDGKVAVKGWVETREESALDLAQRMAACGVGTLIHTDISTDGMLTGPNLSAQEAMLSAVPSKIIASGGVGSLADVEGLLALCDLHPNLDGVIVGKALYEGKVSLGDILRIAG